MAAFALVYCALYAKEFGAVVDGMSKVREGVLDALIWLGLGGCAVLTGLAFLACLGGLLWLAAGVIP